MASLQERTGAAHPQLFAQNANKALCLLFLLHLFGCAALPRDETQPPPELVVDAPFQTVWNTTVRATSDCGLTARIIDRENGYLLIDEQHYVGEEYARMPGGELYRLSEHIDCGYVEYESFGSAEQSTLTYPSFRRFKRTGNGSTIAVFSFFVEVVDSSHTRLRLESTWQNDFDTGAQRVKCKSSGVVERKMLEAIAAGIRM